MFSFKTVLTTLIGTGIAAGLTAPVRAIENTVTQTANANTIAQINYDEVNASPQPPLEAKSASLTMGHLPRLLARGTVDNRYGNEPSDGLKNIVGLTGLAIGTGIIGYHVSKAYKPSLANSLPISNGNGATLITRVNPKLRRELLRLVHNQATADRLLSGTANSHPGRSANWLAEKVIYDLKRDR